MLEPDYACLVFSYDAVIHEFCKITGWKRAFCGVDALVLFDLEFTECDLYQQTGQDFLYEVGSGESVDELLGKPITLDFIRENSESGEAWGKKIIVIPVDWIVQYLRRECALPPDNIILKL